MKSPKYALELDWSIFEILLSTAGLSKADLARVFGIHDSSISRWRHNGVPTYAMKYLVLVISSNVAIESVTSLQERVRELEGELEMQTAMLDRLRSRFGSELVGRMLGE